MFFIFVVLPVTYSRYIETESHPVNSSPLAKWEVNVLGDNDEFELVAFNECTISYSLSITSLSEVASEYSIIVTDIPDGITMTLDDGDVLTPTSGVIIVEDVDGFEVGDTETHNHVLKFTSDASAFEGVDEFNVDMQVDIKQKLS